jgi:salicylate biosynthesis isochorismate synthase
VDSTSLELLSHDAFLDELPHRLARTLAGVGGSHLLSLAMQARDFPGSPGLPTEGPAVWWGRGGDARVRVGAGTAWECVADGNQRFPRLAAVHRALARDWRSASVDGSAPLRSAFLGFAFSPDYTGGQLPNALLTVPRVTLERRGHATVMHFNGIASEDPGFLVAEWTRIARQLVAAARPETLAMDSNPRRPLEAALPGADPAWAARVRHALAAIAQPPLEKLVLTRRIDLALAARPSLGRIIDWLTAHYPEAAVYAVQRPEGCLVGASPERLLGLEHGLVVADALAGSAARAICDDADQLLGGTLLGDPKELAEHAVVVREILSALEPLCTALVASHTPSLMRLPNVQHLASHVHGRVKPEVGVFELLERMHPTPAVGGAPRALALDWLRRHDETDRGWYTGGVGWLDDAGGDIWVALRCAMLRDRDASLYAGAGIVAGSDPEQELRETGWKLQAMLEALAVA